VPRSAALNEDARKAERAAVSGLNNTGSVDLNRSILFASDLPNLDRGTGRFFVTAIISVLAFLGVSRC
jgi:hypothetical protein